MRLFTTVCVDNVTRLEIAATELSINEAEVHLESNGMDIIECCTFNNYSIFEGYLSNGNYVVFTYDHTRNILLKGREPLYG